MINFLLNDDEHWFLLLTKKLSIGLGHGGGGGGGGPTSRKKLKISKRAVKALAARKLPQTFLGLDRWIREHARLAREAMALPLKLPPTLHAFSSEYLEALASEFAARQQKEDKELEKRELLISIFLVRITLLQAQAIAKFREEEEILLLYMLSR